MCVCAREGHNVNSWCVISLIFRPLNNLEQTLKLKMNHKMSYSTQLVYVCKCENCVCARVCVSAYVHAFECGAWFYRAETKSGVEDAAVVANIMCEREMHSLMPQRKISR